MQQQNAADRRKVSTITEVLHYNHQIIGDLTRRLDQVELNQVKRAAVLTGMRLMSKKKDRIQQLKEFFQETMQVSVEIDDCYFIGENDPKTAVIIFESLRQKHLVYEHKQILQEYEGENGSAIYINDYLPAAQNEKNRRQRDVIQGAKSDQDNH